MLLVSGHGAKKQKFFVVIGAEMAIMKGLTVLDNSKMEDEWGLY
jgi:hypothetical protein